MKKLLQRYPRLNAAYRAYRESRHTLEEPRPCALGFKFAGHTAMQSGVFEPEETRLVKTLLEDVEVFINIGANVGYYCCMALQAGKQVVAVEPMPKNLQALVRNVTANEWTDRIELFPMALSERPGIVDIFGEGTGASLIQGWAGQMGKTVSVPMSTVDIVIGDRFADKKCFVLIDVEGVEYSVLKAATQLLSNPIAPIWLVEITVTDHQPETVKTNPHLLATFDLFYEAGYRAHTVGKVEREITREEIEAIVKTGVNTLEVHNFLFSKHTA